MIASRAGVRVPVLNHFVPVAFERDALLDAVKADFAGPVVIGENPLTIDMRAAASGSRGVRVALGST